MDHTTSIAGMQLPDFKLVFEHMPGNSILVAADEPRFTILAVTNDHLAPMGKNRVDMLGRGLFEVFPGNPEDIAGNGEAALRASFAKILAGAQEDQLPAYRYDIKDPAGRFAEYHWQVMNKPVLDGNGNLLYILHTAEDVTQSVKVREQEEKIEGLQEAHQILMQAPEAIAIVKGPELCVALANEKIKNLWGASGNITGKPLLEVSPASRHRGFYDLLQQVRRTGEAYHGYEAPVMLDGDGGGTRYYNFVFQPYFEGERMPVGVVIFATEVTEHVLAKKELKENEDRFQKITNTLPLVMWTASPDGGLTYISRQWEEEYGNPIAESLGFGWAAFIHPDDVEQAAATWAEVLQSGEAYETEFRVRHKNGSWPWQLVRAVPMHSESGELISWYGTNTDIQEKKAAEEITNYRKTLLEAHNNASFDGILLVDAKGKILTCNQRFAEIWNFPPELLSAGDDEAALAYAMTQLCHPQQFIDKVRYLYEHPAETSLDELEFKNGCIIERFGYPVVGEDGTYYAWCWNFKDITIKKLHENAINESETRFRTLANAIPQLAWMTDPRGRTYWYNQRWYDYTGTDFETMSRLDWVSMVHPEFAADVAQRFKAAVESGKEWEDIFLLKNGEGSYRWFLSRALPVYNEQGGIQQWLGTNTDISHQRQVEEDLKESEERFRSLAESLPQLVWVTDASGNYEFASGRWQEFTGITPAGEKEWNAIIHPEDVEEINEAWQQSLSTGEPYKFEARMRSKDGDYLWHSVSGEPVYDNEKNKIAKWVGAFTNIHHIKEEEERKNDFIKIMSHELKTPITSIKGYVQLLLMLIEKERDSVLHQQVNTSLLRIDKLVTKLTRLITEMLDLSRIEAERLEFQQELVSLHSLVEDAVADMRQSYPDHVIQVVHEFDCNIHGDKNRLEQVVINLVTNAIKYSRDEYRVDIRIFQAGEKMVGVSIRDYGIGINKEDHEKIFERFFRVEGKAEQTYSGFGIGLFLVKNIVERHSGTVTVVSEIGKGAEFIFFLPIHSTG
jgi:PAS domain S-box-containing protein